MKKADILDFRKVATLAEIGEAFGVTPQGVWKWEQAGAFPFDVKYKFSQGLLPEGGKLARSLYRKAIKTS